MALRGDERGEMNGPGIMRATEFLEKFAGRSEYRGDIWGRSGVDGPPRWACVGRTGDEVAFSSGRGLASCSLEVCHGFSSRGESALSVSLMNAFET